MADAKLRALERRFADEGDLAAGRELVASRRRAGEPVCGPLLAADVRPPRTFASELPLAVHALTEDDELRWLGNTPGPEPVAIPAHRAWWVQPLRSEAEYLGRTLDEVRRRGIPGLALGGRIARGTLPPLPAGLELLRLQRSLTAGTGDLALIERDPPLEAPGVTRLALEGVDGWEVDPGGRLTELSLTGTGEACRAWVTRCAGRGLPLTRLDLRTLGELDLGDSVWHGLTELRVLRVQSPIFRCPDGVPLVRLLRLDLESMLASDLLSLLAGAPGLRELRYRGALGSIAPLVELEELRGLVLGRGARATPRELAALPAWPHLERLGGAGDLQAGWAEAVAGAASLRELSLDLRQGWPTEAFLALRRLPQLRTLSVRAEAGHGSGWLPLLSGLPLEAFHYEGGHDPDFDAFPALGQLRRLRLRGSGWSAEQLLSVLAHGRLEELELDGDLVPAAVLEALPELQPALQVIRVHGEQVSDRTLAALGRLSELRELELLGVEPEDVSQVGWKQLLAAPLERLRLGIEPPSTSWRQALRFTLHALRANLDLGW